MSERIELTEEAENLLGGFPAHYRMFALHAVSVGKAFCPSCRWAGIGNCGSFDECEAWVTPKGERAKGARSIQ